MFRHIARSCIIISRQDHEKRADKVSVLLRRTTVCTNDSVTVFKRATNLALISVL